MTEAIRTSLDALEHYRLTLEANLSKLRKALQHWQLWEAEYECLKEEIHGLSDRTTGNILINTARRAQGELVNGKEINELLGVDKDNLRTPSQVVALISRRVEYVHKNVEAMQKQFDAAEVELAGVSVVLEPEASTEEGLPVTDIYEELDDDGNVISGKTIRPGEAALEVFDVLKKAGLENNDHGHAVPAERPQAVAIADTSSDLVKASLESACYEADSAKPPEVNSFPEYATVPQRKSISFAAGTKESQDDVKSSSTSHSLSYPENTLYQHTVVSASQSSDDIGVASPTVTPIIPIDESPEDAAIRREMLQYHMSEVGSIVAQLDLDDGENSYSYSDYDDEDGSNLDSTSLTDEEDQYGISANRGLDGDYRAKMMKLEKKLGAHTFQNIGPEMDNYDAVKSFVNEPGPILKETSTFQEQDTQVKEKTVRFADKLDVAPGPQQPTKSIEPKEKSEVLSPMSDKIIERTSRVSASNAVAPVGKLSRFKAARSTKSAPLVDSTIPMSTSSTIPLASQIIEHAPIAADLTARPSSPDEFDPALIHQQVKTEFYQQRNRMIHREGGFSRRRQEEQDMESLRAEEDEIGEIEDSMDSDEDNSTESEPQKKVSLFKAARLKKASLG